MVPFKEFVLEKLRGFCYPYYGIRFNTIMEDYLAKSITFYDRETAKSKTFLGEPDEKGIYTINQIRYELIRKSSHYFMCDSPYIFLNMRHYGGLSLDSYVWLSNLDLHEYEKMYEEILQDIGKNVKEKIDIFTKTEFCTKTKATVVANASSTVGIKCIYKTKDFRVEIYPQDLVNMDVEFQFDKLYKNLDFLWEWLDLKRYICFYFRDGKFII